MPSAYHLPVPNLDDRRFQDLVDDAKRLVQQRCPEWTDHNVHDPGVTLIETFAYLVDQLIYRLNRVPDKTYLAFLDFIGVTLFPPCPARADVTFWLAAPQAATVTIRAGAEVSTPRTETEDAVVFGSLRDLDIVPCSLERVATSAAGGQPVDRTDDLGFESAISCFAEQPRPGDALLLGLSNPVPSCVVALRVDCDVEGVGVDPRRPPLAWEAWNGNGWVPCEVDRDETGGLNRPGDVILHVPASHAAAVLARQRAGWLRCRLVQPLPDQPFYSASPKLRSATAFTIGGTVPAVHAESVEDEVIGLSENVPGQSFHVGRPPVVPTDEPFVVEVADGSGWNEWTVVANFAASGPDDRHVQLDAATGEVSFGPALRDSDGSLRRHGAVPPKGAPIRVRRYRTGGGRRGNVSRGAISVLRTSIPYVERVENRRPAAGGIDGEDVENAKVRGPIALRTRDRAVTAEDYEQLARAAAPGAARVHCVRAERPEEAGGVRLLVVPAAADDGGGRLRFEQLAPPEDVLEAITRQLDERRPIGTRIVVEPPYYQGVTVVARLVARPRTTPQSVVTETLAALYRYFNPLTGGPDGTGWPLGRTVQAGDVFGVLQRVNGVELVEDVRLFAADPLTGDRGEAVARIPLDRHALVFSYEHQVRVTGE